MKKVMHRESAERRLPLLLYRKLSFNQLEVLDRSLGCSNGDTLVVAYEV